MWGTSDATLGTHGRGRKGAWIPRRGSPWPVALPGAAAVRNVCPEASNGGEGDVERRADVRPGEHPGEALPGGAREGGPVPHAARRRRGAHPAEALLLRRGEGGPVRARREGLRGVEGPLRHGHA